MSSQLQDYFEEAVETVARLLYARTRTPREPGWMDLEPRMREGAIRDARVVIDLWIKVSLPCLWCRGTGRTADLHPCRVCGGVGFQRFNDPEAATPIPDSEFVEPPLMPSDPISERMIDVADDAFISGSTSEQAWRECLGDALYAVYPLIREQVMAEASQGKRAVSALLPVNEPPEKPEMTRWEKKQVDGWASSVNEPETDT